MTAFADALKQQAHAFGFELAGIAPAGPADDFPRLEAWLASGYAGRMDYLQRQAEARRHPASILPEVRSVLMLGMNYVPEPQPIEGVLAGRVARYAVGADYHDLLRERLNRLLDWVQQEKPGTQGRGVVDTAPLLERDFARRAGLGWIGKNTLLIHKQRGSFLFLAALLLDLELPADAAFTAQHCGTCTRCLDACPTDAFVGPYQLDARRCISYLTIELRGDLPEELRPGLGDWVFGCDVCQEVCPWNRKAVPSAEPAFQGATTADLLAWLSLNDADFRARFRHTPLWRSKRRGVLRNVALVLGNLGDERGVPALTRACEDAEPTIREAARWALAQIAARQGMAANSGERFGLACVVP